MTDFLSPFFFWQYLPEGSGIYKKTKQNNTVVDSIFKMAFVVNQINWGLVTIDETSYSHISFCFKHTCVQNIL